MGDALVEIVNLTKYFSSPASIQLSQISRRFTMRNEKVAGTQATPLRISADNRTLAVNDFNLAIAKGEIVGLVGESGSGKSTIANCVMRLVEPSSGDIRFDGRSILKLSGSQLKEFRKKAQIVFQDPTASLDSRFTIERIIAEPLRVHNIVTGNARKERIRELLHAVHLRDDHMSRYPHQLSGGERQRVVIARALATNPQLLILDEPTSALDASAQARIMSLLQELKQKFEMTYLVISHDLSVIRHLCERVVVLYVGQTMEISPTIPLIKKPQHPYTQALISAIPIADPDHNRTRIRLRGEIQTISSNDLNRCPLANRCVHSVEACHHQAQHLIETETGRWVACHRVVNGEIQAD